MAIFRSIMEDLRDGTRDPAFSQQTRIICYNALSVAFFLSEAIGGAATGRSVCRVRP